MTSTVYLLTYPVLHNKNFAPDEECIRQGMEMQTAIVLKETGKAAVIHPTGTGKSFIAFKLAEENPSACFCWLSPSEYIYKTQVENLKKASKLIKSPALRAILTWAKPVRWAVVGISAIQVVSTLISLGLTLVTKALVDAATGGNADQLWLFGGLMVALYAVQRGLSVWSSFLNVRTSAKLQRHLQGMVTRSILGKEYASLKPYHSGELVNRVFSDVSVVKNGMMGLLPSLLSTVVSFIGAAVILISWDWRFVPVMIVAALVGSGVMIAFREPMKRRHKRMQRRDILKFP